MSVLLDYILLGEEARFLNLKGKQLYPCNPPHLSGCFQLLSASEKLQSPRTRSKAGLCTSPHCFNICWIQSTISCWGFLYNDSLRCSYNISPSFGGTYCRLLSLKEQVFGAIRVALYPAEGQLQNQLDWMICHFSESMNLHIIQTCSVCFVFSLCCLSSGFLGVYSATDHHSHLVWAFKAQTVGNTRR